MLASFIIAAFNEGRFIEQAVLSCLNQTVQDIEVVVVDDGSTDETWEKLLSLQQSFKDKLVLHRFSKNKGKVAAFNRAFTMSSGDYVAIMGADDISVNDRIEYSLKCIKDYDILCGDLSKFDDETGALLSASLMEESLDISGDRVFTFKELLEKPLVFGGTIFSRREALKNVFPIDEKIVHEDWWIPLCLAAHKEIKYCHKVLCKYRIHSGQDTLLKRRFSSYDTWRAFRVREIPYYEKVLASFDLDEQSKKIMQHRINREKLADQDIMVRAKAISALDKKNVLDYLTVLHPFFCYWWMKRKLL